MLINKISNLKNLKILRFEFKYYQNRIFQTKIIVIKIKNYKFS